MILHRHSVEGYLDPVTICPIGDIQWAGDRRDIAFDHLNEHIAKCLTEPNPLFLGMGDYVDFMSPSNRTEFSKARLYDTARKVVDEKALDVVLDCYEKILKPTKGKWLGLLHGHHYFAFRTGGTTDTRLAEMLDAPFLGVCTVVNLAFGGANHESSIKIYAHHGCGSSSVFPHGPLNKLYRIAPSWNVDILVMGHTTKRAYTAYDRVEPIFPSRGKPRLDHRTVHLVGAGGWSKGYLEEDPHGTYVEQALLSPVALGQPIIKVHPTYRVSTTHGVRIWMPGITVEG